MASPLQVPPAGIPKVYPCLGTNAMQLQKTAKIRRNGSEMTDFGA
jgi:hypothetical protein